MLLRREIKRPSLLLLLQLAGGLAIGIACSHDNTRPVPDQVEASALAADTSAAAETPLVDAGDDATNGELDAGVDDVESDQAEIDTTPGGKEAWVFSPSFVHRDINHVLATGQSLSVGAVGYPAISTKQPYANVMFRTGVIAGGTNLTSLVPLVEGPSFLHAEQMQPPYPDDETMSSAFANLVTKMSRVVLSKTAKVGEKKSHDLLVSVHGIGGIAYIGLKKGTPAYAIGMAQVKAAFDIARAANKSYVVRAVTNVHGESDHTENNTQYAHNLAEWQASYETDVKAITGQHEGVPMLQTQMSSFTFYGQSTSIIPQQQLEASIASKGKIVLVGPKYNLQYAHDGVHLTNEGYRHLGEYYAKVYRRVVLEGKSWEPVRPLSISRSGKVITIKLAVPAPPLVLDEKAVANPGNMGFEYTDTSPSPPAITSVALIRKDTIAITLSSEPAAVSKKRVRYAFTGIATNPAGPKTGARGNLRDSDKTRSRFGYPLYNWCVHFNEAVQ